jgi:hypothetical protein
MDLKEFNERLQNAFDEGKSVGAVDVLEKWVKKLEEYNFSFVKEMKKELKELKEVKPCLEK